VCLGLPERITYRDRLEYSVVSPSGTLPAFRAVSFHHSCRPPIVNDVCCDENSMSMLAGLVCWSNMNNNNNKNGRDSFMRRKVL